MTEQDRQMLLDIKKDVDSLAGKLKMSETAGFHISFNINGAKGECDKFDVLQTVPIDITKKAN